MRKIILVAVLVFSISFKGESNNIGVQETIQEEKAGKVKDIDVTTFSELINSRKGTILDVRTPEEWSDGIIEGAVNINFYDENFLSEASKLPKNKVIYVYCKKGGRSATAANQLKEKGYRVFNLLGGFDAWMAAKKDVVK